MDANEKILVLGGTGHFGARICRRLAGISGSELIVTSRDLFRAELLVDELLKQNPGAKISGAALDQESADFEAGLREISPFAVVHTAGPYQRQDYRVAHACIEAGSHYLDLADGRDFVAEFEGLHDQAVAADVLLVSGASTLPGLSSAVIGGHRGRFRQIDSIEISIAPAQLTPRGLGTVAGVLSYCGQPFEALVDGQWRTQHGWQGLRRQKYPALGRRLSALCDVPDLELLPRLIPGVRTVSFHAALATRLEHLALWFMAWMRRARIVADWSRYARTFVRLGRGLSRFGSDQGGMRIHLKGEGRDGRPVKLDWDLLALDNHGPEIPCTPAVVLVRKLLRDEVFVRGALPCLEMFTEEEFMQELDGFSVSTAVEIR